jgi:hypothetical protein
VDEQKCRGRRETPDAWTCHCRMNTNTSVDDQAETRRGWLVERTDADDEV